MVEEPGVEEQTINVDHERCIGCFECVDICPQTDTTEFPVYDKGEDGFPRVVNPNSCIGCLSCEANCRAMAITVQGAVTGKISSPWGERAEGKCAMMF